MLVNRRLLTILHEEDPHSYEETLALLGRLGHFSELHTRLQTCPEVASLAAIVLETDKAGPKKILDSLPADQQRRDVVYAMYTVFVQAEEAILLAERLANCGDIMTELWLEGPIYVCPFLIECSGPDALEAQGVYLRWVENVYLTALRSSETKRQQDLERAAAFLFCHEDAIKRMLGRDSKFREKFLNVYWPRYHDLVRRKVEEVRRDEQDLVWTEYSADPRVWQFLREFDENSSLDEAFRIFDRYGCVAVDLWLSPEFAEAAVRESLLEALEQADEAVLSVLANPVLRSEPLFIQFLKRKIPRSTYLAGLWQLSACGDSQQKARQRLEYWAGLSDQALTEELGPPPRGVVTWIPGYQTIYLLRKAAQGREITGGDLVSAACDAASFIPLGAGSTKLISVASKGATTRLARGVATQSLRKGVTEAAERLTERKLATAIAPAVAKESLAIARTDITGWARLGFHTLKRLGFGREVFRKFSGLEPRIFMRGDRCVFLNFAGLIDPASPFGKVLGETALNAGTDVALSSPVGQSIVKGSVDSARHAWRQFVSATWLAVGLGKTTPGVSHEESQP